VDLAGKVIGIPTLAATDPQLGGPPPGSGSPSPATPSPASPGSSSRPGKVSHSGRASLGITAETVADANGQPAGVGVVSTAPGGAAAHAGIQAGDIIVRIAGQPTGSLTALQAVLAAHQPGDQVLVRFARNGTLSTVQVTLGSLSS
jgi:putative serine protease PepD